MLQQTQVTTVLPYYRHFLETFPTVEALAAAPLEAVLRLWSGLGYYSRARHLWACARQVVADHAGIFPDTPEALQTLPGIGPSTAAAIAVFSAGRRAAILDGNVKRVLCRVFGVSGWPGTTRVAKQLWALARALLPEQDIQSYTQGLMDLGATLCTPRRPRCAACPLAAHCVARAEGRIDALPARRPARRVPTRRATLLVLHHDGAVQLVERPARGIWGGLFSLPEWPDGVAEAELVAYAARFGRPRHVARMASLRHGFTHFTLEAQVCAVDLESRSGTPPAAPGPPAIWLDLGEAEEAALPAPIKRILTELHSVSPRHPGTRARAAP